MPVTLEIREAADGEAKSVAGAIKYSTESEEMTDWWGDSFVEELAPRAFEKSLQKRNVVGLWSHDTGQVLGNTKNGTLRLQDSEECLGFEMDIPNTTAGNDAWTLLKRGDVDGVSFGMIVAKDKWSKTKHDERDVYKRTILDADLYEISPVAFPAYPANEVKVRSLEEFKAKEKRAADEYRKQKLSLELELL